MILVTLSDKQMEEIARVMNEAVSSLTDNPILNFPKDTFYFNPVSFTINRFISGDCCSLTEIEDQNKLMTVKGEWFK